MLQFARDTRHRERELENPEIIARKFLCTQLPTFVNYEAVYPFIADDLEAVKFRAPNVLNNYRNYHSVSPKELGELVPAYAGTSSPPILSDFCAKVQPPPGKELLTFFIQGQKKKGTLLEHVEALGLPVEETQRLCRAIREYMVPEALQGPQLIKSIGEFLREMPVGESTEIPAEGEEEKDSGDEEGEEEGEAEVGVVLETPPAVAWGDEKDHWENPVLKAFKVEANLSTAFSTEKTAKQIFASLMGHSIPQEHLGKFQSADEVPRVEPSPEAHQLVDHLIDSRPAEAIESIVKTPEAQNAFYRMRVKPTDNRAWVKTLVRDGLLTSEMIKHLI